MRWCLLRQLLLRSPGKGLLLCPPPPLFMLIFWLCYLPCLLPLQSREVASCYQHFGGLSLAFAFAFSLCTSTFTTSLAPSSPSTCIFRWGGMESFPTDFTHLVLVTLHCSVNSFTKTCCIPLAHVWVIVRIELRSGQRKATFVSTHSSSRTRTTLVWITKRSRFHLFIRLASIVVTAQGLQKGAG